MGEKSMQPTSEVEEYIGLNKIELADTLLTQIHSQIHTADGKVRGLFGANTLFAAALAFSHQVVFHRSAANLPDIFKVSIAIVMVMSIAAALSAVLALLPTTKNNSCTLRKIRPYPKRPWM
jgi:hypothetical protein